MPDPDDSTPRHIDAALVERARTGDRHAMAELHRNYARMVHAIVLARSPASEAEDIVQDVFVQAMTRLDSLSKPSSFGSWIGTIARNAVTDHYRRRRPTEELGDDHESSAPSAAARVQALEVLEVIRGLPETYRETLIMRLVEGMTGPEIAERSGMTPGSVRIKLHRGMTMLREQLAGGTHRSEDEVTP